MAQLWLSYDECADLIDTPRAQIRDEIIRRGYDRRKSHDGLTRVKLPQELAETYMTHAVLTRLGPDAAVAMLRRILAAADGLDADAPSFPAARAAG